MPEKVIVTPAPGRIVRDPQTLRPLPPEGATVVKGPFWLRRARCGDVTINPQPAPAAEKE